MNKLLWAAAVVLAASGLATASPTMCESVSLEHLFKGERVMSIVYIQNNHDDTKKGKERLHKKGCYEIKYDEGSNITLSYKDKSSNAVGSHNVTTSGPCANITITENYVFALKIGTSVNICAQTCSRMGDTTQGKETSMLLTTDATDPESYVKAKIIVMTKISGLQDVANTHIANIGYLKTHTSDGQKEYEYCGVC